MTRGCKSCALKFKIEGLAGGPWAGNNTILPHIRIGSMCEFELGHNWAHVIIASGSMSAERWWYAKRWWYALNASTQNAIKKTSMVTKAGVSIFVLLTLFHLTDVEDFGGLPEWFRIIIYIYYKVKTEFWIAASLVNTKQLRKEFWQPWTWRIGVCSGAWDDITRYSRTTKGIASFWKTVCNQLIAKNLHTK